MSKKYVGEQYKRRFRKCHKVRRPRQESRYFCPDCGAPMAPGKKCMCLYEIPAAQSWGGR